MSTICHSDLKVATSTSNETKNATTQIHIYRERGAHRVKSKNLLTARQVAMAELLVSAGQREVFSAWEPAGTHDADACQIRDMFIHVPRNCTS